jgi:hypothetical protein
MATLAKTRLPWKPLPAPTGDFYQPAYTGVGFESQFADRLFEAFFTTKTDVDGHESVRESLADVLAIRG